MPASVRSLWMASEPESCKVSWMEWRKDKNKSLGNRWEYAYSLWTQLLIFNERVINLWRVCVHSRDLSMILCDPFACNTLVLSIMRNLQELLSQDSLPRVSILCRKTQKTSWRDRAYGVMVFSSFTAGGFDIERNIQSCEASKKRKKTSTKETWIQTV